MDSSDIPRGLAAGLSSEYKEKCAFESEIRPQSIIHLMPFFVLSVVSVPIFSAVPVTVFSVVVMSHHSFMASATIPSMVVPPKTAGTCDKQDNG